MGHRNKGWKALPQRQTTQHMEWGGGGVIRGTSRSSDITGQTYPTSAVQLEPSFSVINGNITEGKVSDDAVGAVDNDREQTS